MKRKQAPPMNIDALYEDCSGTARILHTNQFRYQKKYSSGQKEKDNISNGQALVFFSGGWTFDRAFYDSFKIVDSLLRRRHSRHAHNLQSRHHAPLPNLRIV